MAARPSWKIALAVAVGHFGACFALADFVMHSIFSSEERSPEAEYLGKIASAVYDVLIEPGEFLCKYIRGPMEFWVLVANSLLWGVVIAYLFAFARSKIRRSTSSGEG
jgi:hypothetical protein